VAMEAAGERTIPTSSDQGFDRPLFIAVLLLLAFGLVMVYSASAVMAAQRLHEPTYFLVRQVIYGVVGLIVMLVTSRIDYHFYRKLIYPFLGLSVVGLVLCHTPLGLTINGAARWIDLGPLTIQPSEFVKVALVLWLSYSLAKKSLKIKSFSIGFLPHLLIPGAVILLCLLQPDFGTAVVIAVLAFSLLFVAGAKLGYIMAAGIVAAPIAYLLVAGSEYRLKRLLTFLDPLSTRFGDGYQLSQSLFGFGAGGLTGVGLGDGLQKFLFLPEAHNDFIVSIIAEELGVIGVWAMILLFAIVVARGVRIGVRAKDEFGTYLAIGLTILVGVQVLFNLGVAMGLLPTKGLNLPFVSFGGSALVVSLFAVGVLLNISRERELPEEHSPEGRFSQGNVRKPQVAAEQEEGS
jgi:cell division protein FtsW